MTDAINNNTASFHHHLHERSNKDADSNHNAEQQLNILMPFELDKRRISMSGSSFQLFINVSNAKTGVGIVFKQDGQRFGTSPRTFKFCSDTNYRWTFKCKPDYELNNFQFGGNDLTLTTKTPGSGEYIAAWNTTGIEPTRKGARQDYTFTLSCLNGTLQRKIQTKFYPQNHAHAEWGHKFDSLIWACNIDVPTGIINISNEQVL